MYLNSFNFRKPKTIAEALGMLSRSESGAVIAGGTDILVEMKKGMRNHSDLISLSDVNEVKSIAEDENSFIIGAGMPHSEVIASEILRKELPALPAALSKIGSEQIRNRGTLGGNLCSAVSCCDSAPILMAMDAQVEVCGAGGARRMPLREFFLRNRGTKLKMGEIMTKVIVSKAVPGFGAHYEKFGLREAVSISVASAAAMVKIKDEIVVDACIAIGAVAPTPLVSKSSTEILIGKNISELSEKSHAMTQIGEAAAKDSIPIDDIRGTAQYRRDILKVISQRAVLKAVLFATGKE